jgi:putative salt-induced outer membrane protein YdiY
MKKILSAIICFWMISTPAYAIDHIETLDGGILTGKITSISETSITLSTAYAGDLTIQRDKIKGFDTEKAVFVRLKSGTTVKGQVHHTGDGQLVITGQDLTMTTRALSIAESWQPQDSDPQQIRSEKEREALKRKWSYQAGLDIVGRQGNSDQFGASVTLGATLKSTVDTLKFYASLDKESQAGIDTANEIIFGSEYTAYFTDPWGWYVRGEVERDDFENIELRTLVGAGLNYRVFKEETHSLELRTGLGYRYESFTDGSTQDSPTLDFGLAHAWQFVDWADMTNNLTYTPAINDFGDYLLTHDSGINIPLGLSQYWNLRFGLRNDYKSLPAIGRKSLDTSYYSRFQLKW